MKIILIGEPFFLAFHHNIKNLSFNIALAFGQKPSQSKPNVEAFANSVNIHLLWALH